MPVLFAGCQISFLTTSIKKDHIHQSFSPCIVYCAAKLIIFRMSNDHLSNWILVNVI